MGESTPATPASKYFAASVAMIAGAFFFAVGAGLLPIPGGPSNLHGPLWLVLCVGLAFFLAGVAIIIQLPGHANDSGDLPAGAPLWLRAMQYRPVHLRVLRRDQQLDCVRTGRAAIQRNVHVRRRDHERGNRPDRLWRRCDHHLAVHRGVRRLRLSQTVRSRHIAHRLIGLTATAPGNNPRTHRLNRPMISALASVLKCRLKPTTAAEVSAFTSILSAFTANTVNR
jgi:hypothetical protein